MKLGIDIGGTFTDLVLLDEQEQALYFGKTLTTYPDPTLGILNGVREIAARHGQQIERVHTLVHGTTLVTNAVIERKGAKTALITTKGFEDVLEIGREMRYDIYDIFLQMPRPLVDKKWRKGVAERVDYAGKVLTPLDETELAVIAQDLVRQGVQSVAVSFLHSFRNPAHEQAVGEYLRQNYPALYFSLSSDVMPEIREYERTSATVMNAYVQPLTDEYLKNLAAQLRVLGFTGIVHIMISSGRLTTIEGARRTPIQLLESGPAGGAMAGVFFGKLCNKNDLLAFDMGGTTAKASLIRDLAPERSNHFEAAREKRFKKGSGLPVRIPVIDLIEIGAGGGSIARVNHLGLLQVGPDSAASMPGPACYGRGGEHPTVTDADLVLGLLDPDYFLGGTMTLRRNLAEAAIDAKIARPLGISVPEAAWGIHRMVNENMANAARVHILEKGLDPRRFSMLAFGGAGPVHAFSVARLLNAPQLIIPAGAGVLSALGFLVSPVASEALRSFVSRLDQMDWTALNAALGTMEAEGRAFLAAAGIDTKSALVERVADMRYAGQGHEISVAAPDGPLSAASIPLIAARFKEAYQLRYGRSLDHMPLETVTWRVVVSGPSPELVPSQAGAASSGQALKGSRPVWFGEGYIDTPVYERYGLPVGQVIQGPCIIEEFESTTVVGPESRVQTDVYRNILIDLTYKN